MRGPDRTPATNHQHGNRLISLFLRFRSDVLFVPCLFFFFFCHVCCLSIVMMIDVPGILSCIHHMYRSCSIMVDPGDFFCALYNDGCFCVFLTKVEERGKSGDEAIEPRATSHKPIITVEGTTQRGKEGEGGGREGEQSVRRSRPRLGAVIFTNWWANVGNAAVVCVECTTRACLVHSAQT